MVEPRHAFRLSLQPVSKSLSSTPSPREQLDRPGDLQGLIHSGVDLRRRPLSEPLAECVASGQDPASVPSGLGRRCCTCSLRHELSQQKTGEVGL